MKTIDSSETFSAAATVPQLGPIAKLALERASLLSVRGPVDDAAAEELGNRIERIDAAITALEVAAVGEVIAKLKVARDDFWERNFAGRESGAYQDDRLILGAMDNALRFLQQLG